MRRRIAGELRLMTNQGVLHAGARRRRSRLAAWVAAAGGLLLPLVSTLAAGMERLPGSASPAGPAVELLRSACVSCHGPALQQGGLRVDSRGALLRGGRRGPAIVPGRPGESVLLRALRHEGLKMPPRGKRPAAEIAAVERWIAAGAPWPAPARAAEEVVSPTWALQPLRRPAVPSFSGRRHANPIDAFVSQRLHRLGLRAAPPADRRTLIRRLTFDLHGVPPTPEEIDAFLADTAPGAYERLVDRLLASPRYGERWARHWLDVVRFGESQGYERDKIRDHAWRYRDWVIRALNDDMPYDRFVRAQVAGDVLELVTPDGIVATGFLVAGPYDEVGNQQQSQVMRARVREEELEDMLATVGQTFLALTVNCARCHDHKFDPITQHDYYRLKAALDGVRPGDRPALTPGELESRQRREAAITEDLRSARSQLRALRRRGAALARAAAGSISAPQPLSHWDFEGDARDRVGGLDAVLRGKARIEDGRLVLDAPGSFAATRTGSRTLRAKTLAAWVRLYDLEQRGGGVVALEAEGKFDALVYAERQPGRWVAGSDFFKRTRNVGGPVETERQRPVHLALTYGAGGRVQLYRNGTPYGSPYTLGGGQSVLETFPAGGYRVLLGLRHTDAGNGYLFGEIEEASLYDRDLEPEEVAALYASSPHAAGFAEIAAALGPADASRLRILDEKESSLERALAALPPVPQVYAVLPVQPEPTRVLKRGDVEQPAERVSAGGLSCLVGLSSHFGLAPDAPEGERRRKLADWLTDPRNGLLRRVIVNRVWHYHFGRGIAGAPSDFGFNGERPSHPELLDWLAAVFLAPASPHGTPFSDPRFGLGGSLKALHRLIVLSETYLRSSRFDAAAARVDAENRFLWRSSPRRLEGEAIRDAMLCVSGQMNWEAGGPGFRPFKVTINNSHFYTLLDPEEPEYQRRSVYRINVQSARDPLLETLDCPDPSTRTPQRSITTTPVQALGMMNGSFVNRQARHLARRASRESGGDRDAAVRRCYLLALGRPPGPAEHKAALQTAAQHGLETVAWALFNASEFGYLR